MKYSLRALRFCCSQLGIPTIHFTRLTRLEILDLLYRIWLTQAIPTEYKDLA